MTAVAGNLFTALTLSTILTNASLTINLVQNFGDLANSGALQTSGSKLVGSYGNAEIAFAAIVVALGTIYLIYLIWQMVTDKGATIIQKVYYITLLFSVVFGIASAGMDMYLVENYTNIASLDSCPAVPIPGENYSLCGAFGTGTLALAIISLTCGSFGFLWFFVEIVRHWSFVARFDVNTVPGLNFAEK